MHVDYNNVSHKPLDSTKELYIHLKGHGFRYCFGSYDDSNHVFYTQWMEEYVKLKEFLYYEELRKTLKLKQDEFSFNKNSIVEITQEEYNKAFIELLSGLRNAFIKYEEIPEHLINYGEKI